jgi:GTP1/Obg family GTP-binding protein
MSEESTMTNTKTIAKIKTEIEGVCKKLVAYRHNPNESRVRELYSELGEHMTELDQYMPALKSVEVATAIYNRVLSD